MFKKKYGNIFALKKGWKRVFGFLALISALFVLGLCSGCIRDAQKEEGKNILLYCSNDLGFELAFPESWEGKHLVEESDNSIGVYSKIIKDRTEFPGQLFSVVRLIGELITEEDIAQSPAPEKIIHKGNGYTFVLKMPSDIQYPPHNEEMAGAYKSMEKDVMNIAESISLIGNNVPEAENDGFKVIGSPFFTAEIPANWHIEPVEGAAMNWHIKDIGWIRFIPYYTDTGSEEFRIEDRFLIAYLSDERLLRKVEIVFRDVDETLWARIAASFDFKEGPFTSVDMETTAQQYVNAGGKKIFGEIAGAYFKVSKLDSLLIKEMKFINDDNAPNGFRIETLSEKPVEYPVGQINVLPLAPPDCTNYKTYYMLPVKDFIESYDYQRFLYNFIVGADGEIKAILGKYIP